MQAPENPWRVPAPTLVLGKHQSVIIDRGQLKKAVPASNNHYLFSETGAGVSPLVIIGTPLQITEFLLNHGTRRIENQIRSLPAIYMGISPYIPKAQFSGVFPLNELLIQVAGFLTNLLPAPNWSALIGAPDQLVSLKKAINDLPPAQKAKGNLLYVKFSYLPEDKMSKIATTNVSFEDILKMLQRQFKNA